MPSKRQRPPDLTELPLPPGWREFHESPTPQTFRHIQKLDEKLDPCINLVLDAGNYNGAGWIHPWTRHGLYRNGVKILDIAYDMDSLYQIWPELLKNPLRLNDWLEEQLEGWSHRERKRQGLPPRPAPEAQA